MNKQTLHKIRKLQAIKQLCEITIETNNSCDLWNKEVLNEVCKELAELVPDLAQEILENHPQVLIPFEWIEWFGIYANFHNVIKYVTKLIVEATGYHKNVAKVAAEYFAVIVYNEWLDNETSEIDTFPTWKSVVKFIRG